MKTSKDAKNFDQKLSTMELALCSLIGYGYSRFRNVQEPGFLMYYRQYNTVKRRKGLTKLC